jgi:ABC-2 type transport system ATP-binding protein
LIVEVDTSRALDGVSFNVRPGRAIAIAGPARSGKSLLLSAILGQNPFTSGTIRIAGFDVRTQPQAARNCTTWIAGTSPLQRHLTVLSNIAFLLQLAGRAPADSTAIEWALRRSDIPDRLFVKTAASLSPREALSVWLAVARLRDTPVLLLDDPTERLTAVEGRRLAALIRDLASEGRAIVVTTRDPTFAELLADEIWLLDRGRLLSGGQRTEW